MTKNSLIWQRQMLSTLADGQFCSGQRLAEQLGISRTAVANHIHQLQQLGLDIYVVKGRGYCLATPITLLDAQAIRQYQSAGQPPVIVQHITDSTNTQIMQRLQDGQTLANGLCLVAEAQTAGRGRRGRQWFSPYGSNIYFSMYWRLDQGVQAAMGLSLAVAIAVCQTLQRSCQLQAQVKWPNDIYLAGKKLAGILVELAGQADASCDVIIGIGVNISMPPSANQLIDQIWTDINSYTQIPVDRNQFVSLLQQQLIATLQDFSINGFSPLVRQYNLLDHFANQHVSLRGNVDITGVCKGVDEQGGIVLQTADGLKSYYGGELSVRRAD